MPDEVSPTITLQHFFGVPILDYDRVTHTFINRNISWHETEIPNRQYDDAAQLIQRLLYGSDVYNYDYELPPHATNTLVDEECQLCFASAVEVRLQPCGHAHTCLECMRRLRDCGSVFSTCCPFCRAVIASVESV